MRAWMLNSVASCAVAALLMSVPSSAAAQGEIAAGAKIYGEICGRCHNPRAPTERTDREWTVIVTHMRVRAGLSGEQARRVRAFLQAMNGLPSLASLAAAPVTAPEPEVAPSHPPAPQDSLSPEERGKALVEGRGCVGCHVVGKTGGDLGPSLNGVIKRRGEDFVKKKLQNPTFDNPNSQMVNLGLSDAEIDAIVAYLKTLGS